MSCAPTDGKKKYKGVRRRKWGKWVSEIRVPGTQERLWLGTYATAEAAATAHDVAFYCLRRPSSLDKLNFPEMLPKYCVQQQRDMSPRSVQKVASDAGMAVDAQCTNSVTVGNTAMATETETEKETDDYEKKEETDDHLQQVSDRREGFCWEADGCKGWQGSEDYNEGEALTISIEDYL